MYDEKELVNYILQKTGQSTTPTLETQHPSVQEARAQLASSNKAFQARGYWFNREKSLKLLPDAEGKVRLPTETLSFTVTQCTLVTAPFNNRSRFVQRGAFIYDTVNHTNVLNAAVWVDLIVLLTYSDLPATAAEYLKCLSAEEAFLSDDGDTTVYRLLQLQTQKAWQMLYNDELKSLSANQIASPMGTAITYYAARGISSSGNANIIGGGWK